MEGMQEIQKKLVRNGGDESALEPEVVRHSADLPRLADWSSDTAPILTTRTGCFAWTSDGGFVANK